MTEFYTDAVKELKYIYDSLNKDYYDGSLPEVVITIQSSPKGKAYGWYSKDRWGASDNSDIMFDEINISAEYLSRPIEEIASTMNHECVHLDCVIKGIKDTSNNNVYHNKRFKEEAEKRGLIISKAQTIGWSVTTPSEEFKTYIKSLDINEDSFKFFRKSSYYIPVNIAGSNADNGDSIEDDGENNGETKEPKKKSTKYTCPNCGIEVRGFIGLHIKCCDCDCDMIAKKQS
jgi:hypothetical protein